MQVGAAISRIDNHFSKVAKAKERAEKRFFFRAGAYVRTTVKRSLRKRKKPAAAGQPPSSPTGNLKKSILFAVEPGNVVIGAAPGFGKAGPQAARALEHGGRSTVILKGGKRTTADYEPRPFMLPGLEKSVPALTPMWEGAINKAAN